MNKVSSSKSPSERRIGYIVEDWPSLSETFVYNEVCLLLEHGLDVRTLSLKRRPVSSVQLISEAVLQQTTYRPISYTFSFWAAHFSLFIRSPVKYLTVLKEILGTSSGDLEDLLRQIYTFSLIPYAARWASKHQIDHLHAHFAGRKSLTAWAVSLVLDISFSFTLHAGGVYRQGSRLIPRLERSAFTIAVSHHLRETLLTLCGDRFVDKIRVLHTGVRTDQLSVRPQPTTNSFIVIAVARLVEAKGFFYLIDACSILTQRGHEMVCMIVGEGPLWKELNERVTANCLAGTVRFLGPLPHADVIRHISRAYVMALPCLVTKKMESDGIPVSLMEAMVSGVPVVTTPVGGIPELVKHMETGLLVPERDALALADTLEMLWEQPELRNRLAARGQAHALMEFDLTKNVTELATAFRSLI